MDLADWWHGLQRVQPGSASGTQSQEAWHRHKLKKRIGSLRQSLDALLKCLGEFTQSRLKDLQATEGELPDVPIETLPRQTRALRHALAHCAGSFLRRTSTIGRRATMSGRMRSAQATMPCRARLQPTTSAQKTWSQNSDSRRPS